MKPVLWITHTDIVTVCSSCKWQLKTDSAQQQNTAMKADLNEFEQNILTSLAHVIATNLFAMSQHTVTTEKLQISPSVHKFTV